MKGLLWIGLLLCLTCNSTHSQGTGPYHQGSSVTYHCDDGYSMTGDNTLTSKSNGAWDKPAPTCNRQGIVKAIIITL